MRERGLGHIYQQRGSSRWWVKYSVNGQVHRESSGSVNRSDAVRLLKRRIADIQNGKPVGSQIEKTTIADICRIVRDDYRANQRKSADRLDYAVAHLLEFFPRDTRCATITSDRITAYQAHRQKEQAASATINIEVAALRRAFRLAKRAGRVALTPEIQMLHTDNARKGFFEPEQHRAVLRNLPDYLRPFAQAAYITGWRKSELLSREWRHVDLDAGWLRLDPGESKTSEARMFPLDELPELRALLLKQREWVRKLERALGRVIPQVFVHPDGTPIKNFRYSWQKACRLAGVPGRLVHDFRRTAVRNLERAGVPRSAAMAVTGHKTETVYRRYAIVDEGMMREAGKKLALLHASERG